MPIGLPAESMTGAALTPLSSINRAASWTVASA
jgi:hypothetical protein